MPEPMVYADRITPDSLHNRLKDHVLPRVMKFLAIEETTKQDWGTDAERFYQKCKALFEKRYPQFGSPDAFKSCKEYLQNKPKFASYRRMLELEEAAKKEGTKVRPNGKKKDAKKLIGEALKEAGVTIDLSGEGETVVSAASGGGSMDKIVSLISSLGKTLMEHWKQEGEATFIEALPTPEKRGIKAEMAKVHLLGVEAKRRCLEMAAAAEELNLLQEKEKVAAAAAAAPPIREVNAVSRNSVSSLGQYDESPNKCCAGSKYCIADEPEIDQLSEKCVNCNGKAHSPCVKLIVGSVSICYECYWKNHP